MKSLADAIATCHTPGLEKVREWFVNAVPIRSQFIEIPPSRTMMVRLKTITPIPGKEENTLNANRCYFGYNKRPVHYQRMGVQRREKVVTQDVVKYGGGLVVFADLTTSLVQVRHDFPSAVLFLLQPQLTNVYPAQFPNVCIAIPPFTVGIPCPLLVLSLLTSNSVRARTLLQYEDSYKGSCLFMFFIRVPFDLTTCRGEILDT